LEFSTLVALCLDYPERSRIGYRRSRHVPNRVVQGIEGFQAEFGPEALPNLETFEERGIEAIL
jgi:hypothetical protein